MTTTRVAQTPGIIKHVVFHTTALRCFRNPFQSHCEELPPSALSARTDVLPATAAGCPEGDNQAPALPRHPKKPLMTRISHGYSVMACGLFVHVQQESLMKTALIHTTLVKTKRIDWYNGLIYSICDKNVCACVYVYICILYIHVFQIDTEVTGGDSWPQSSA